MGEASVDYSVHDFAASDGYRWRYRLYEPETPPRGHVVFVHGIQSHAGWYGYSCDRIRRAGYRVSFLDRRGSGMNAEGRGDAPGFRRLIDDIGEYLRTVREREPRLPLFLAGISWGGKLAVGLHRRHAGLVNGLALLCPGFFARVAPGRRERLAILWARLTRPRKRFAIPLSDPALFTATPRWQAFIRDDPLSLREATARFLVESVRLGGYVRLAAASVHEPVLLLLAGRDRVIDNDRTRQFVMSFPAPDKQVQDYDAAHHTLEFEPQPDIFLGDLLSWLDRVSASPNKRSV